MLLIGVLLAGAGIVGGAVWLDTTLHRQPVLTDYPNRPAPGRGTNWLLVGSDSREGLSAGQQQDLATGGDVGSSRTDTILLVHIPGLGSSTPTTMVSIPRDSFVPIPGHGEDKINSAFAMGGAPLLTQTVEQATGLRLDHYAEIGFSGFAVLVDALGGITVCPTTPINDPLAGIDLPAGCQELDGRNALGYVRTRDTPRADLDRMVNQRQFISALLQRAAEPVGVAQSVALVLGTARRGRRADRRRRRSRMGPGSAGLGAARIHDHADRSDRRVHQQQRRLGRGVEPRRGRQAVRRAGLRLRRCPPPRSMDSLSVFVAGPVNTQCRLSLLR